MQTNSEQPAAIPVTAELIRALDIVINLAEGNCLDQSDPDMEDDPETCCWRPKVNWAQSIPLTRCYPSWCQAICIWILAIVAVFHNAKGQTKLTGTHKG